MRAERPPRRVPCRSDVRNIPGLDYAGLASKAPDFHQMLQFTVW